MNAPTAVKIISLSLLLLFPAAAGAAQARATASAQVVSPQDAAVIDSDRLIEWAAGNGKADATTADSSLPPQVTQSGEVLTISLDYN